MSVRLAACIALSVAGLATALDLAAQSLPRSGSILFHTGWKESVGMISPSDRHVIGHGTVSDVTFNDKGVLADQKLTHWDGRCRLGLTRVCPNDLAKFVSSCGGDGRCDQAWVNPRAAQWVKSLSAPTAMTS